MSGRWSKVLNILISFGFLLIVVGFLFLFSDSALSNSRPAAFVYLAFQLLVSLIIIYTGFFVTKRIYHIFSGCLIFTYGIVSLFFVYFPEVHFSSVWPLYAFFPGVILIICSFYKYKKLKVNFALPSIFLLCMSLYYFLFSFGIIKFSFSFVSYFAAPALTIGCLVCFIAFYFLQKNHKELMLKDEDSENFSEEEFPDEDF